jgi:guanyl-specific ribonuclease Sa
MKAKCSKILSAFLALVMILSLAACGTGELSTTTAVTDSGESQTATLPEDGTYTTKDDVALYLHLYGHLPDNFITKQDAEALGWSGGSLEPYAPGMCIGGSRFGNYEGLLPTADGRTYQECDIDTLGASSRGAKRIVYSNDGLIYYTDDHYESFTLLYGEE